MKIMIRADKKITNSDEENKNKIDEDMSYDDILDYKGYSIQRNGERRWSIHNDSDDSKYARYGFDSVKDAKEYIDKLYEKEKKEAEELKRSKELEARYPRRKGRSRNNPGPNDRVEHVYSWYGNAHYDDEHVYVVRQDDPIKTTAVSRQQALQRIKYRIATEKLHYDRNNIPHIRLEEEENLRVVR